MSLLSNVPFNLIAGPIIETMEQGRGMEKEERERSGARLRRRNVRARLQYISVIVEGTKVCAYKTQTQSTYTCADTHRTIMSCLIVSHISLHLLH